MTRKMKLRKSRLKQVKVTLSLTTTLKLTKMSRRRRSLAMRESIPKPPLMPRQTVKVAVEVEEAVVVGAEEEDLLLEEMPLKAVNHRRSASAMTSP